ncbi:Nucleosome assembly protein 1-like 4 [Trichinella pseudospiralis]|uniref:Nucleosome assembly protein 1-like 4 n=1 Tax=Trichinella pseudospiralis TaxID=6337 RepID=A0A0V1KDW5_TRIPS|nr:Nucleosome assembly protein 1-like 4 [Trichinella pseudospiralis]
MTKNNNIRHSLDVNILLHTNSINKWRTNNTAGTENCASISREFFFTKFNKVEKMTSDADNYALKVLLELEREEAALNDEIARRVYELEAETLAQLKPLYQSRRDIIMGRGTFDFNDSEELLTELFRRKIELNSESSLDDSKRMKSGLPGFWLEVLNCSRLTASVIMPYDTYVLKYLVDISIDFIKSPMGYRLKFYFAPNKYFSNRVLVKEAYLEKKFSRGVPYDSACWRRLRLNSCKGCTIKWYPGKNLTVHEIRFKQRSTRTKQTRYVIKAIRRPSFFNFFDSYSVSMENAALNSNQIAMSNADLELFEFIRTQIVPRAELLLFLKSNPNSCENSSND